MMQFNDHVSSFQIVSTVRRKLSWPYFKLLILLIMFGCGQNDKPNDSKKIKTKLTFQIIPEDYERNLYYIAWNDTLGISDDYLTDHINGIKRPQEIWCIISNQNNDTLGYYNGLSTAQSFAYFQATDSIVTINFMIGLNYFSDKFDNVKNKEAYEKATNEYCIENNLPIEFEPIEVNIKTELRKNIEIEIKEK